MPVPHTLSSHSVALEQRLKTRAVEKAKNEHREPLFRHRHIILAKRARQSNLYKDGKSLEAALPFKFLE